jgi:hypothetical protein
LTDANASWGHDHDRASDFVQVHALERYAGEPQIVCTALFRRSKQDQSRMTPWRVTTFIGEFLVGRNEPAILTLHAPPELIIRHSLPTLVADCHGIVSIPANQIRNFAR